MKTADKFFEGSETISTASSQNGWHPNDDRAPAGTARSGDPPPPEATNNESVDARARHASEGNAVDLQRVSMDLERAESVNTGGNRFASVLFLSDQPGDDSPAPEFLGDLHLDQIIASVTGGKEEYRLEPFFYAPLHDVDAISFRHEVMRDLEEATLLASCKAFAESMQATRTCLARSEKLYYQRQKERWFLDAVNIYCDAIERLEDQIALAGLKSRGMLGFREYLAKYFQSTPFLSLLEETRNLEAELSAIHYSVFIKNLHVRVGTYQGEPDYGAEVEATFERFKQGAAKKYPFDFIDSAEMNHVEAQILELVAKVYHDTFSSLENFRAEHQDFLDPTLAKFDREIQFYIAYLDHIAPLKAVGLSFCYPRVVAGCKEIGSRGGFDLALTGKLLGEHSRPICNDFHLSGEERIIVVSGPNQGGKTTFARAFGQLHYLAGLGCQVPGTSAQLLLFDQIYTHFEREENVNNFRGKLQDDLVRVQAILERVTTESVLIMNEIFTSTTLQDAILLSNRIAEKVIDRGILCVWVTFVDEVATLGPETVSMVSTIVPGNPAERTYKIIRRPSNGLSYALTIAEKYGLTYEMINNRISL